MTWEVMMSFLVLGTPPRCVGVAHGSTVALLGEIIHDTGRDLQTNGMLAKSEQFWLGGESLAVWRLQNIASRKGWLLEVVSVASAWVHRLTLQ